MSEQRRPEEREMTDPGSVRTATTHDAGVEADAGMDAEQGTPLVGGGEDYMRRWEEIQARFVDEPRGAVQQADELVKDVIDELSRTFEQQRDTLEHDWRAGEDVSTEDLRRALRRYRMFFQRLVSV